LESQQANAKKMGRFNKRVSPARHRSLSPMADDTLKDVKPQLKESPTKRSPRKPTTPQRLDKDSPRRVAKSATKSRRNGAKEDVIPISQEDAERIDKLLNAYKRTPQTENAVVSGRSSPYLQAEDGDDVGNSSPPLADDEDNKEASDPESDLAASSATGKRSRKPTKRFEDYVMGSRTATGENGDNQRRPKVIARETDSQPKQIRTKRIHRELGEDTKLMELKKKRHDNKGKHSDGSAMDVQEAEEDIQFEEDDAEMEKLEF
jgi:hypothetical protein